MISGVSQGSVLGPVLFSIYINDLENKIGINILKFADDTNFFRRVESQEDRHKLQVYLNKLVKGTRLKQNSLSGNTLFNYMPTYTRSQKKS